MIIKRTTDIKLIHSVLKDNKIERWINDDSGNVEEYPILDNIYYLAAYEEELAGLFVCFPLNHATLDGHFAVLPKFYGKKAIKLGRLAIDWIFNNTHYLKINGSTPAYNKLALKYAQSIGFKPEGINRQSYLKDNKLYDQIYFGLRRESWV